jgi:hypothetical protein
LREKEAGGTPASTRRVIETEAGRVTIEVAGVGGLDAILDAFLAASEVLNAEIRDRQAAAAMADAPTPKDSAMPMPTTAEAPRPSTPSQAPPPAGPATPVESAHAAPPARFTAAPGLTSRGSDAGAGPIPTPHAEPARVTSTRGFGAVAVDTSRGSDAGAGRVPVRPSGASNGSGPVPVHHRKSRPETYLSTSRINRL